MKKYLFLLCVLCITLGVIILIQNTKQVPPIPVESKALGTTTKIEHSSHLFEPEFFTQAYNKGLQYQEPATAQIFGGIIPHHLTAAPLIAGFFEGIENQNITTVILLSPNHYQIGPFDIATSKGTWTTIFGDLETDITKVSQLENEKTALVSEDLFNTEHGIYGITPFIKKSFPNAKMVPVVIKGGTSRQQCDQLAQSLLKIDDGQTIIIVSSDFSHYLPSNQADLHDQKTIPAIESFDLAGVFNFDHVKDADSPESIYTLLKVMQLKSATKPIFLVNSNSAKLTGELDVQSTTSYLTIYFSK